MTRVELQELADHWVLPLSGQIVVQCRYDYAFTLVVGESDPPFIVRISEPFTLYDPEGTASKIDPEADPRTMSETLRLLRARVTKFIAHKDGRLEIDFHDGTLVRVPSAEGYEPWELSGPDDLLMVVNTDGELVVWS